MIAGWLIAGYVVLETLPWTRNIFNLGMPHRGTIAAQRHGPRDRPGGGDRGDPLACDDEDTAARHRQLS